jgi:predicted ATP-grasp superfamily ATP-dependent carboligase
MLQAVLADFRAWGAVHTITTLDQRVANLLLPADELITVTPGQHSDIFAASLTRCDAALIIAPETDGILARLNALAQGAGVRLLGSSPQAVTHAGDKWTCYQSFLQAGLPTPTTRLTLFADACPTSREMGYPLVAKPVDGVGCEGVCLVTNEAELDAALIILRQATRHDKIILQSFVDGTHASVSLLVAHGQALPVSLNGQAVEAGCPFVYRGGCVPLLHPSAARALAVAQAAVDLLPGLQGYVGVDLVLTNQEAWLMEINPRLTTTYIGLRQVIQLNLAQAMWQACFEARLPDQVSTHGQVFFAKDELLKWGTTT